MPTSAQFGPGGQRLRMASIVDGTSNTIMVAESAEAVHRAKPDDIKFDPQRAPKLGDPGRKWFYALYGDGSVRTLRRDKLTDEQIRALMTVNGGEVVSIPD